MAVLNGAFGPVVAGQRKHYNDPQNRDLPMTRRDGSVVEFLEYFVGDEQQARSITLDVSVNGGTPAEGEVVEVLYVETIREEARIAASGRPYISRTPKRRAIGFRPVKPAA